MVVRQADQRCIEAAPIDAAAIGQLAEQSLERLNATGAAPTALPAVTAWSPFVACDGRTLHVNCTLETVLALRTCQVLGLRIRREVLAGPEGARLSARQVSIMSRADVETIDRAAIYQGMELVRQARQRPSLIGVPISLLTLNSSRGRQAMLEAMKEARELASTGLICALHHVEESPSTNLLAARALVRPYCLKSVANLIDPTKPAIRALKHAGIDAVGIETPPFDGEAQFISWTKALISWAAGNVGGVGLYNLPNERRLALAATLGVNYGSMQAQTRS